MTGAEVWKRDTFPLYILSRDSVLTFLRNDTLYWYAPLCKTFRVLKKVCLKEGRSTTEIGSGPVPIDKVPFLSLSGNVQYDYVYQSFVDTPYFQRELRQHSVRANLHLLLKDKYPLNLTFSTRQRNSSYFVNFFDVGLQFNKADFERRTKQAWMNEVETRLWQKPALAALVDLYDVKESGTGGW